MAQKIWERQIKLPDLPADLPLPKEQKHWPGQQRAISSATFLVDT